MICVRPSFSTRFLRSFCLPVLLLAVGLVCETAPAAAQSELKERLDPLIAAHRGDVSVYVKNLANGETYAHRADEPMPTASLIKLPVLVEALRQAKEGRIDLDARVTLRNEDKVPGSGVLTEHFGDGAVLSLRDCLRLMIVFSDNTATNLVVDAIGLPATRDEMRRLGLSVTALHSKVYRRDTSIDPDGSRKYGLGVTTAVETGKLLEMLEKRMLLDDAHCQLALDFLKSCQDRTKLARFLPRNIPIAHKSGYVDDIRTDAGVIYGAQGPIVLAVLTRNNEDRSTGNDNAADLLCGRIAETVYQIFNADRSAPVEVVDGELALGAHGVLVSELQRTLNQHLPAELRVTVDGEFGPATQSAVIEFQRNKQLEPTGKVGPETWKSLGPLVTADEPAPSPDVVNNEKLPLAPPLALDGPPEVSAKAWAICNAQTGELLWGGAADAPLENASTTKIMTALLVLRLAEKDPNVLDEVITASVRCDATPGSTADLRAGEQVSVRECLYGLLLPSGNDAATAFAEHFGRRFAADRDSASISDEESYKLFVDEMNRVAKELGLRNTQFRNPHGLSARGHHSSARDLAQLARAAGQHALFREVTSTRRRGALLTHTSGYQRPVVWENTNQLLKQSGFVGVKTGTTGPAGACLVSRGVRNGHELIVVVLGSTSPDGRYVDSRNLYRFAWSELEKQQKK